MAKHHGPPQKPARLDIEGEMTIYRAMELKGVLLNALEQNAELEVNLSQVEEIDTSGLQLMVLAKREAAARAKTFRFVEHSQAVVDALELFELSGRLGDPVVIRSGGTTV
ncbi:STAS domain-containing protein [Methyloterricola oryzae]|uniref:STAS domain-containing protein n=1 Tax=Methyloterricola oryzae TaxID=1495050 RepID=UPI0005EB0881|nr:STAS domain-containing protein [Methyloterricola oryzae]